MGRVALNLLVFIVLEQLQISKATLHEGTPLPKSKIRIHKGKRQVCFPPYTFIIQFLYGYGQRHVGDNHACLESLWTIH
ncbi:hypothetical protein BX666DRAFT_1921904 [Dichotomocladium elegans]|nr:hypothetical protein BX666DRAFT_1921904 [Dichotomocladium elegans]